MIFAPGPAAFLSSASAFGNVAVSPDGSPDTKHTARPSCAVTCVSALPRPARLRLLFQPFATGLAPVQGTKWSST
jgi:hypothetical protein